MNSTMPFSRPSRKRYQNGAAAVEFALVAVVLFTLILGIFEFGRLMFTWNSAVEATRRGARLAVVCDPTASARVKSEVRSILPVVAATDIRVTYMPSGCTADTCQSVTVEIANTAPALAYVIPFLNASFKIPAFSTTLSRESLQSGSGGSANPDCN